MNYKAVLFDFDYTLGDATEAILTGFNHGFEGLGLPRPDPEAVRATVGYPLEEEYRMLTGDMDPEHSARFRALYIAVANPLQEKTAVLFPGARELLDALRDAGVLVGVVSTKRSGALVGILSNNGVADRFATVVGGDMVQRMKPDPEGLLLALERLELAPEQVLFCGDTVLDAGCAQSAGVDFCAVLNGTTPAESFTQYPCVHIAADLFDLNAWLERS